MPPLRWRFPAAAEEGARVEVAKRIDAWWREFAGRASELEALFKRKAKWDLPAWMDEHFHPIGESLFWEFGPGIRERHRLVVTCEANRFARPLVDEIVRRAPKVTGFDVFGYRLPESLAQAEATVEGRTGVKLSGFSASVEPAEFGTVAIDVFVPRDDRDHRYAAFVLVETLLGEEALDRWGGPIDVVVGCGRPLERLKADFDALVAARLTELPSTPWCVRAGEARWSLLELTPRPADDWVAQEDLFVGKTVDLDLFKNAHFGAPFDSRRFSRVGETFAYLKIDGAEGLPEGGFPDKASIEDAIDEALIPRKLGCHVGGGTGKRYSYVDLALTDVDATVPVLLDVLQRGKLPKRSWLQFFDRDLAWEWIGIWPDSPPPPLPAIDG